MEYKIPEKSFALEQHRGIHGGYLKHDHHEVGWLERLANACSSEVLHMHSMET